MSNTEVAINTAGDNAVLSAVGNAFWNHKAGWQALLINMVTLSVCSTMRAISESRKNQSAVSAFSPWVENVLKNQKTSLAVSAITQLGVAATFAFKAGNLKEETLYKMAVPALFSIGSFVTSRSVFCSRFHDAAAETTTTARNFRDKAKKVLVHIFGEPDLYWNAGFMFAGGAPVVIGIFATGLTLQMVQGLSKIVSSADEPRGVVGRFMNMDNAPLLIQAGGCAVSAAIHAHGGQAFEAASMGLFTLGFLGYVVDKKWKGLVEACHAARPAVKKLASSTSALIA